MKLLPCQYCPDGLAKLSKPGGDNPREPNLYYADSYPGQPGHPHSYKCLGCTHFSSITVHEFHALPEVAPADYPPSVVRQLVPDLTLGGAVPSEHAEDMVRAGVSMRELEVLEAIDRHGTQRTATVEGDVATLQPPLPPASPATLQRSRPARRPK